MLLQKSLVKLLASSGASSMRLWGKIKGTKCDYYVAEGTLEAGEGDEGAGESSEPRGTGVNKFAYWVCNSPLDNWSLLPDLKPSDIINARGIKHTFSGDVNAKIFTNPFYFDREAVYLRAQIARITQSTTLIPKTLYRFVEETNEREIEVNAPEEGEIVKPTTKQMCAMDMWLHFVPSILKQGRVKHSDPKPGPGQEEMEPEELMKLEIAKDPWEPMLKPITKDTCTRGGMPAWVVRSHNLSAESTDPRPGKPNVNYGCVVVKSLWWPGAMSLYSQGKTLQIYVGDGQKLEPEGKTYYPVQPPVMVDEKDEKPCCAEPNPTEEFLAAKAEAEAKKQEAEPKEE